MNTGTVRRVNGPVVEVVTEGALMGELVEVGEARLPGEVIAISGDVAKSNGGMHKLDTRQTFLLERQAIS